MKTLAIIAAMMSIAIALYGAPPVSASKPIERDPSAPIRLVLKTEQPFSANAVITVTPADEKLKPYTINIAYAWRNGNFRAELDPQKPKDRKPADSGGGSFGRGLNQISYITSAEQPVMWMVYSALRGFVEKDDPLADYRATPRVEKSDLGKDTVDGHPCTKRQVVVTATSGASNAFTVWEADDLNGVPVEILFAKDETKIKVMLSDISTNLPDADLFRVPDTMKRYDSQDELMTAYVIQMLREIKGIPSSSTPASPAAPLVPQTDGK